MGVGHVRLRVRDPEASAEFYGMYGFRVERLGGGEICLSADGRCLIYLARDYPLPQGGYVYHFAVLLPSRAHLSAALRVHGYEGAADHWVSEAIYLSDLDGIGLELYVDRPREAWKVSEGGLVAMAVEPLDLRSLLRERPAARPAEGARIGHVHLRVEDVEASAQFYRRLGLRVTGSYRGAVFLAVGHYHHHVALNRWPVPPPLAGSGLSGFSLESEEAWRAAVSMGARAEGDAAVLRDPAGFLVEIRRPA